MLNLEKTPEFVSCSYVKDCAEGRRIKSDPEKDTLILTVRGTLACGEKKMTAGRYLILRAGDAAEWCGSHTEFFSVLFNGDYSSPAQSIPLSGKFDYKDAVKYINRLLELRDKRLDGQSVPVIEEEALFCHILAGMYSVGSMSEGEYLAKSIMRDIIDGYASRLTLEALCEKYFYSRNYIIRVFRKKYQVTPYRHIIHLRIEKAKQLLSSTGLSCQEIAGRCGYGDMSTFYKAFISETGESPERWRNRRPDEGSSDYRSESHAISGE